MILLGAVLVTLLPIGDLSVYGRDEPDADDRAGEAGYGESFE